jgi:uncharacterized membrane protein (UPF0127 family)
MIQIKMTTPTRTSPPCLTTGSTTRRDSAQVTRQVLALALLTLGTVLLTVLLALPRPAAAQAQAQQLPTIELSAGMHRIEAEVAATPAQRQIGLMNRPTMPPNHGMLFIFEGPGMHCFWMRNTLLPLSIAFLGDDGHIVNIADMQPQNDTSHCPREPVRYALEMNQGWFAKRGFKAGDRIGGAPFARK